MKDKKQRRSNDRRNQRNNDRSKDRRKEKELDSIESEENNFVFGHHASVEALQAGRGNKLFMQEDAHGDKIDQLKSLAKEQAVPVKWVPKQKLDTLSDGGVHQGIVLGITPYEYLTLEDLMTKTSSEETPFLLILDSLEDPHNFGSILRTADASGVSGVIIPKHRSVGITPVVTKASTGAVEYVPIARVTNLAQSIKQLKDAGYWIFGTDMTGTDYRQWKVSGPIALIIGNEGKGMSAGLKKEVDEMLTIPMTGHVQSLNAGVAAGLLMYEVFRKRSEL